MTKKIVMSVFVVVFLMSVVAAAWAFSYDNTVEGEIKASGKKLDVILDLSDFMINTTTGNLSNTQNLTLDSAKDDTDMEVNITANKTLTEVGCPDYENDCSVWFGWINGTEFTSGDRQTVFKGENYYNLITTCVEYSCGQNISVQVAFNE